MNERYEIIANRYIGYICSLVRAGKNLRFFKKRFNFLGFLGFNVRTVALGTLETGIRSRRRPIHED